ncbi:SKP1-like protein 21 isoform X1 [Cynara cardunculus var. scolymus]|uniref:SKP1-like protein 21 isoform X1 n=1 Tax=Cynara cardunculus var. scolymus TaxID=59895 RepID=UPI000D63168F|nr:SKP1-like protein 21 isoform X1 [Cynara cardunculus var. scolymus]XP_024996039.1 SKP1-like protein 21 isoform X1 [Cynara cardunculus var. scolymus]
MSGSDISKRQMKKSYIWLQTSDGSIEQVEQDMILFSSFIHHMMHAGMGSSKTRPIALPSSVTPIILGVILGYFRFHRLPGRSDLERKFFDEKFFRMETRRLYELTASAYTLQMAPLVELCCDALARQIEGKSIEEIRQALGLPDDTTEEERWKTIKIAPNDPQVRLLNKLHAKKMKEKEKVICLVTYNFLGNLALFYLFFSFSSRCWGRGLGRRLVKTLARVCCKLVLRPNRTFSRRSKPNSRPNSLSGAITFLLILLSLEYEI